MEIRQDYYFREHPKVLRLTDWQYLMRPKVFRLSEWQFRVRPKVPIRVDQEFWVDQKVVIPAEQYFPACGEGVFFIEKRNPVRFLLPLPPDRSYSVRRTYLK